MSTFQQESDRDLSVVNGQLVLVQDQATAIAIKLRNRFLFVKGEYWLDTRIGVPYRELIWVKNPDLLLIKSLFRQVILSVPGVASVPLLDIAFDRAARILTFNFSAVTDDGATITGGSDTPFIVGNT